jgi:hypothetical protein
MDAERGETETLETVGAEAPGWPRVTVTGGGSGICRNTLKRAATEEE